MPAGTITLTNGSTAVTGSGTSFATELKVNDFLVAVVGGVTYTLGVQAIGSATALTLTTAYNGPTTSGLSWTALPNAALVGITAQVAADVAKAIRGFNFDKVNWQKIFSNTASVTVTLPDLTSFTGPSWGYMADQYASKASKGANSDITSITGLTTALSIAQGGTGQKTAALAWNALAQYGTVANTAAQGNDSRLNTVNGKSGGTISSAVNVAGMIQQTTAGAYYYNTASQVESSGNVNCVGARMAGSSTQWDLTLRYYLVTGSYHCFQVVQNSAETFRVQSNGYAYATTFNNTSDSNLKFNKEFLTSALANTVTTRGMSYNLQGAKKAGIIAQDVQKFMPEAITTNTDPVVLEDGTILNETLSLDYSAIAGLHTEAIKELIPLMMEMLNSPETAKEKLKNLIAAINTSMDDANPTDMKMEWSLLNPPATPVPEEVAPDADQDNSGESGT